MNELEMATRPIITPLILGTDAVLRRQEQLTLARWIALKVMVLEHDKPNSAVVTQTERHAFRSDRTIPAGMTIRVARCGDAGMECVSYLDCVTIGDTLSRVSDLKNMQVTTICIGQLVAHVSVCALGAMNIDERMEVDESVVRIWPPRAGFVGWPGGVRRLTEGQVWELATRIDIIRGNPGTIVAGLP